MTPQKFRLASNHSRPSELRPRLTEPLSEGRCVPEDDGREGAAVLAGTFPEGVDIWPAGIARPGELMTGRGAEGLAGEAWTRPEEVAERVVGAVRTNTPDRVLAVELDNAFLPEPPLEGRAVGGELDVVPLLCGDERISDGRVRAGGGDPGFRGETAGFGGAAGTLVGVAVDSTRTGRRFTAGGTTLPDDWATGGRVALDDGVDVPEGVAVG